MQAQEAKSIEETCGYCGVGFSGDAVATWFVDGRAYHDGCVGGHHEYERGVQHGRDDLAMSQRHARDLQRQLDEAKREVAKWKMWAHRLRESFLGLTDNADDPVRLHDWGWIDSNRPAPNQESAR